MADTNDLPTTPEKRVRKTPARKASDGKATPRKKAAPAAKKSVPPRKRAAASAAPAAPTFAESATQARAALNTATAAARAKIADMTDKAKTLGDKASGDWKAQGEKLKAQGEQWYEKAEKATKDTACKAEKVARTTATSAKTGTGNAMQGLARLISATADTVDSKLGPQYGDYARTAASAVADTAKSIDDKDIDEILAEARDFVRKSPAVAIGAAAIAGYVLMRLAKGSSSDPE